MIIWHRGQVGQTAGSWAPPQAHGGGIFEDGANEPALSMLPEGKSYSLILTWKGPWTRAGVTDTVGSMFKKCFVDGGLFREFPEFALTCLPCTTLPWLHLSYQHQLTYHTVVLCETPPPENVMGETSLFLLLPPDTLLLPEGCLHRT